MMPGESLDCVEAIDCLIRRYGDEVDHVCWHKLLEQFSQFQRVRHFMRVMGQETPDNIGEWPDVDVVRLRASLIQEEFAELMEAFEEKSIVEVADAIGDLLYVVYGTAAAFGINADAVFDEVHRSNMTKIQPDGTVIRNEQGKVQKPATFRSPDIESTLAVPANRGPVVTLS